MIVIVEECELMGRGYVTLLEQAGVAAESFRPSDSEDVLGGLADGDLEAVEAVLVGQGGHQVETVRRVRQRLSVPLVAVVEKKSLEGTLALFNAGVDDVLERPVHIREILVRIDAIQRRRVPKLSGLAIGRLRVHLDGLDPEIDGSPISLPRRELRILQYLVRNRGRRVTKTQIFHHVYGLFDTQIDETVVECHISKLRKRLRKRLGYDPIDSRRHLGYRISDEASISVDA